MHGLPELGQFATLLLILPGPRNPRFLTNDTVVQLPPYSTADQTEGKGILICTHTAFSEALSTYNLRRSECAPKPRSGRILPGRAAQEHPARLCRWKCRWKLLFRPWGA